MIAMFVQPQADSGTAVQALVIGLVILVLYFLPTAAAWGKSQSGSVFVLNLFLGWTLIGWVIALSWGLKKETPAQVIVQSPTAPLPAAAVLCRSCGKYSGPTSKFCDNCGQSFTRAAGA
jgi:hypothetical protein